MKDNIPMEEENQWITFFDSRDLKDFTPEQYNYFISVFSRIFDMLEIKYSIKVDENNVSSMYIIANERTLVILERILEAYLRSLKLERL